ncbi:MAG: F0F1 ATP synthase subunit delta [Acidimicrobiia bacterium]
MIKNTVLPDEVFSIEQLQTVLNEIDQYIATLNRKSQTPSYLGLLTKLIIEANHIVELNTNILGDLRNSLTKLIKDTSHLDIRTALPVLPNVQMRINDWVKNNVSKEVLLSFKTDHTLLAGVVIQTPKERYDHSLRNGLVSGRKYLVDEVKG